MHRVLLWAKKRLDGIKKHKKRALLLAIPIIVLLFIFWPRPQKPIETQTVKKADIVESISATGTLDSQISVDLKFLSGGNLVYLGVKKGDHVKKGQTIAMLDQRTVQKNLETELRDYSLQRNSFDATLEDNQNRTPEQALNSDMRRILQNNQYDLEKAVISVELQDLAKQQAVLSSPIDGIVTAAAVTTAGMNVSTTTNFTIADPNKLTFKIDIDESDIGRIKLGQTTKIILDAFPDKNFNLKVKSIDFAAHTTTTGGNVYTVEVAIPNTSDLSYRIGMNGDAEIITNEKKNVLIVPLSSIVDDKYVYVKKNGEFEKREIKIGLANDVDAEVRSGLTQGEEVAIDPTEAEKIVKK